MMLYVQGQIILEVVQQNSVWSKKMEIMQICTIVMFIIIVMEVSIQFNIVRVD